MNIEEYWKITPGIGDINYDKGLVKIILQPQYIENVELLIRVNGDEIIYTINIAKNIPTYVLIKIEQYGLYEMLWYQNNNLIYENKIKIGKPDFVYVVSCDLLEADVSKKNSMWNIMNDDIDDNYCNILLHLGDQAYCDGIFNKCKKKKIYSPENIIIEYGNRYSKTWLPHHNITSKVVNKYLLDDHEIFNNIDPSKIYDAETQTIINGALMSYELYQNNSRISKNFSCTKYSWYEIIDDILFFTIERTTKKLNIVEYLIELDNIINNNPIIKKILIGCSFGAIPFPKGKYGKLYSAITRDDNSETSKFLSPRDLKIFYNMLFDIIDKYNVYICVTGGDLHFGTFGKMIRNNKIIDVIVSSPITNYPSFDRKIARLGLRGSHLIDKKNNMTFYTHATKAKRCYFKIDIREVPFKIYFKTCKQDLPHNLFRYMSTLIKFI